MAGLNFDIKIKDIERLKELGRIIDDLKAKLKTMPKSSAFDSAVSDLANARSEYKELANQLSLSAAKFQKLNREFEQQSSTLAEMEKTIISLREQLNQTGQDVNSNDFKELESNLDNTVESYKKLGNEALETAKKVKQSNELKDVDLSYDQAIEKAKQLQERIAALNETIAKQSEPHLNAYNKFEEYDFAYQNNNTVFDESSQQSITVTKEKVESLKLEFDNLNKTISENRAQLDQSEKEYQIVLEIISEKAKETGASVKKDLSSSIDSNVIRENVSDIEKSLTELGDKFAKAKQKTGIISEKDIQQQRQYLKDLEKLQRQLVAISDYTRVEGSQNKELNKQYEVSRTILKDVRKEIKDVAKSLNNASKASGTYRTQMRKIEEQMAALELAGKSETERYRKLESELARIGTAYNKVATSKKLLTTKGNAQLDGLIQGVTGVAGAFTAAQGAASLFAKNNEQLAAIQTKLQAAMSITIGLQQVSNTLHTTSSFRIETVRKITELWRLANVRLSASLISVGVASKAAQIASAGLLSVGIGALIVGVGYLINKYKEWNKQQQEIQKKQEEYKKFARQFNAELATDNRSVNDLIDAYKKYNKNSSEHAKIKNQIISKYGKYIQHLIDEKGNITDIGEALKTINNRLSEQIALKLRNKAVDEITEKGVNRGLDAVDNIIDRVTLQIKDKKKINDVRAYLNSYFSNLVGQASIDTEKASKELQGVLKEKFNLFPSFLTPNESEKDATAKRMGLVSPIMTLSDYIKTSIIGISEANQEIQDVKSKYDGLYSTITEIDDLTNKTPSTDNKERKTLQQQADYRVKIANEEAKATLEAEQRRLDNEQAILDSEQNSFDKQQKQLDLNHKKALLAIQKRAQELVEKQQKSEREAWDIEQSKLPQSKRTSVFTPTTTTVKQLSATNTQEINQLTNTENKLYQTATDKLLKSLTDKYKNYNQRRLDLDKSYNDDIKALDEAYLKAKTTDEQNVIRSAIEQRAKVYKQESKSLNEEIANDTKKNSDLFVRLFKDSSQMTIGQIKKVITETQQLYDYLSKTKDEDITDSFGFTADQLRAFKASANEMKAILDGLVGKKKELGSKSEFSAFQNNFKDAIDKIKKGLKGDELSDDGTKVIATGAENIGAGIQGISSSVDQIMPKLNAFADQMQNIFGGGIGDALKGLNEFISIASSAATGLGKIMQGDFSGILDIIDGASKFIGHQREINKQHKEALRILELQRRQMEQMYQIAQLQAALKYEQGDTVFGSDGWGKASNAAKVYTDSVKAAADAIEELKGVELVTGSRKSGWGPWKKRKDVWSPLLEQYKDLIAEDGTLNIDLAKSILSSNQTMTDEGKQLLQDAIDYAEQVKAAYDEMHNYLAGIFGQLGSEMTDAFVNAFKNGESASDAFYKSASNMLEKLAKDMIYSVTLAPLIEKAQKQMDEITKNDKLTDEERFAQYADVIGKLVQDGLGKQDEANRLLERVQQLAKDQGLDAFGSDTNQSASKGVYEGMSQAQADELNGRFSDVQMSNREILASTLTISDAVKEHLLHIQNIESLQIKALFELRGISKNTQELYAVNSNLRDIKTGLNK